MNTNTNIILASAGLPSSFAGIINQFCLTSVKDTGWTWGDAIETSLDSGADIDFDLTPLGRFLSSPVKGVVGFTWRQAIEESLDAGHEVNLDDLPIGRFDGAPVLRAKSDSSVSSDDADDIAFTRLTGWSYGAVIDLITEMRRDVRLNRARRSASRRSH